MKQVPVFFLSLYISPSACFSVTHDVLTHSRWAALVFFPWLQTHSHRTELSTHISEIQPPHRAISGAERCTICPFFNKLPILNCLHK